MKQAPKLYMARASRNGEDENLAIENNLAIITHGPWNRSRDTSRCRLWSSSDLVGTINRNYHRLPAEIQAELPLNRCGCWFRRRTKNDLQPNRP